MSLKIPLNKNGKQFSKSSDDFHRPSTHDPIFQKELLFIGCPYCASKKGRKKNFVFLWKLFMHIKLSHPNESDNFKSVIWNLSDYLMRGILK